MLVVPDGRVMLVASRGIRDVPVMFGVIHIRRYPATVIASFIPAP